MKNFIMGFVLGLIVGVGALLVLGNRYEITPVLGGIRIIKMDKWTGNTWTMRGGEWHQVENK
ncbi:MAG: hypothetical protein DRR08_14005 [Candidatus Parabeggiatoa sp. nov. 2]|nr:MAG: hypothetical protein B6247_08105 [Beggiatoa sp. 4572_84]RKZ59415.1 MAG: hypothetical protein DRR08_14005 [Gammaproteobacteria bacterium]